MGLGGMAVRARRQMAMVPLILWGTAGHDDRQLRLVRGRPLYRL